MEISEKCYHPEIHSLFCSLSSCENYGPCCFNCFKKYHNKHLNDCYCLGTLKIHNKKMFDTSEIIEKYINELKDYLNSLTILINDEILILEKYKNCNIQNLNDITKYDLWDKLLKIDDENFKITIENINLKIKEKYYKICKNIYNFNKNYNKFSLEAIIDASLINNFNKNFTIKNNIDKISEIYFSPKFDCELISFYSCIYNQYKNDDIKNNNSNNLFGNNNFNNNNSIGVFGNNNNNRRNNFRIEQNSEKIIIQLFEENEKIFDYEINGEFFSENKLYKTHKLLKNKKYKLKSNSNLIFEGYYIDIGEKNPFFNFNSGDLFLKKLFITPFSLLKIKTNETNCILSSNDVKIV